MSEQPFAFTRATREQARLRLCLMGPPGSGKTYSALAIAEGIGGRIAFIDTEHGAASKYAHLWEFDTLNLTAPYTPERYIEAMHAAEDAGYNVIIIDSLSHAWAGTGGVLEQVDKLKAQSYSKDAFTQGWSRMTPVQTWLQDSLLACRAHLIVCLRSKMEYVLQPDERGKVKPERVGMKPIQRDELEYEFDLVGAMDQGNTLTVTKTRVDSMPNQSAYPKPGKDFGRALVEWCAQGIAPAHQLDRPLDPNAPQWWAQFVSAMQEHHLTGAMIARHIGRPYSPQDISAWCKAEGHRPSALIQLVLDARDLAAEAPQPALSEHDNQPGKLER